MKIPFRFFTLFALLWALAPIKPAQAQSITITSPAGVWYVGQEYKITWTSFALSSDYVNIDYSITNGSSWINVANHIPNRGTDGFIWTIPNTPVAQPWFRIEEYGPTGVNHTFVNTQGIIAPTLSFSSVLGGTTKQPYTQQTITWNESGPGQQVSFELSKDNGASWFPIRYYNGTGYSDGSLTSIPGANSATIIWPEINANLAKFKIKGEKGAIVSGTFAIEFNGVPFVWLTKPVGQETFATGQPVEIVWSKTAPSAGVVFSLYAHNENGRTLIDHVVNNEITGTYLWTPTNFTGQHCKIEVNCHQAGECHSSFSPFYFTLSNQPLYTVVNPNGGDNLEAGSAFEIEWSSHNVTDPNVNLYLSTDNGFTWNPIVSDEPNDGSFTWTVPNQISNQCRIKVIGSTSVGFDESDATFSIVPGLPIPLLINPTTGPWGAGVEVAGSNLNLVTGIKFNGVTATITGVNSGGTHLGTVVPNGATTGKIEFIYAGGSVFSDDDFVVCLPHTFSVSPVRGATGSSVFLTGNGFNPGIAQNVVYFGAVRASVLSASSTLLWVEVPPGTTRDEITVTNLSTNETFYGDNMFTVTFPPKNQIVESDFEQPVMFQTFDDPPGTFPNNPSRIAIGDIDGDGKPDLAVAQGNQSTVAIFRNTSVEGSIDANSLAPHFDMFGIGWDVELVDLNGDGKRDLVSCGLFGIGTTPGINIYQNQATPGSINSSSFSSGFTLPLDGYIQDIAYGDLNADGKSDLVVTMISKTDQNRNIITVYPNTSSGGSLSAASFGTGFLLSDVITTYPYYNVKISDMDGDGRSDVVIGGRGFVIFPNQHTCAASFGAASFLPSFEVVGDPAWIIEIADFNNDGKPDLYSSQQRSGSQLGIYQNQSTPGNLTAATFSSPTYFSSHGLGFMQGAIGDINGDGYVDIWMPGWTDLAIDNPTGIMLRNRGIPGPITNSSFESYLEFSTGGDAKITELADIDMDGRLDLICGNHLENITVRRYNPQPSLPPQILSFSPTRANPGQMVTIKGFGFLPQSGNRPAKTNGPSVQNTLPPTTQDNPRNRVFFGLAEGIVASAVDTQMAVIVPYGATFDRITVLNESSQLTGTSSQAFTPTYQATPVFAAGNFAQASTSMRHTSPRGVAMGDLDGDGKADMVVVNNGPNPGTGLASVSIYRNISTPGTLDSAHFQPSFDIPVQNDPVDVAIADLNGDGKPEIVLCHKASSQVTVMGNESNLGSLSVASFPSQQLYWVGDGPVCVKVGDLNNDGKPDIATANFTSGNFSVLENQHNSGAFGMSSFATTREYDGDLSECTSIAIGQLDNEYGLDIAVTSQNTNTVRVFRNKSHEAIPVQERFKPGQILATGTLPQSVKIADFDGDGKNEVVVACSELSNPAITFFKNQSTPGSLMDGSFSESIPVGNAGFLEELEVADMNGDGRLDLITVEGASDRVYIYPNIHTPGNSLETVSFDNRINLNVKRLPTALVVGDLDNDGRPDIVTSNNLHNSLSIIHNDPRVTVTATAGDHGSITPSGSFNLSPFSDPEFVIEAENGYEVEAVLVNGEPVLNPELDPFVLENLDGDQLIQVTFRVACPDLSFITVPSSQQTFATFFCEEVVTYLVVANNVNEYTYRLTGATVDTGSGTATGHLFKVGTTQVKIYAYNSCNEVITYEFDVTVRDTQIPVMTCQGNIEVTATNGVATVALPDPTYSDNCSVTTLTYSYTTPSAVGGVMLVNSQPVGINTIGTVNLLVGTTQIQYDAFDLAVNSTGCVFTVTVLPGISQPPAKPVVSPATGTYSGPQMVSITSATPEAAIYYTVSGNTPVLGTGFTKLYTQPFQVLESTTIRAMCVKNGFPNSTVDVSFITISNPGKVSKPIINPNGGTYDGSALVTISTATPDAQIYYTTNGNTPRFDVPNSFTKLYTGAFTLFNTASVKAVALKSGLENSPLVSANFVVNAMALVATPAFNPAPGNYPSAISLNITCSTPEATIYYTTTGNVPRLDVPNGFTKLYSGPVSIPVSTTVRALAVKSGMQQSTTAVGIYTIGPARIAADDLVDETALWYESSDLSNAAFRLWSYPNPGDGRFTLSVTDSDETAKLIVLNFLGQVVCEEEMDGAELTKEIDIRAEPSGIYTLVYQSSSVQKTLRLIKR